MGREGRRGVVSTCRKRWQSLTVRTIDVFIVTCVKISLYSVCVFFLFYLFLAKLDVQKKKEEVEMQTPSADAGTGTPRILELHRVHFIGMHTVKQSHNHCPIQYGGIMT